MAESTVAAVVAIPINRIRRFPGQPRRRFPKDSITKLARSLKRFGQKTPIEVIRVVGDPDHDYELVEGERRLRAAKEAELETLNAVISGLVSVSEQFIATLVANHNREEHTPLETALACEFLQGQGHNQTEIADLIGVSQPVVNSYLKLLDLHPNLQSLLEEDDEELRLRVSVASVLTKLAPEAQLVAYEKLRKEGRINVSRANILVERMLDQGAARHEHSRVRRTMPRDHARRFWQFIERFSDEIVGYSELDWPEILAAIPKRNRKRVLEDMALLSAAFADLQNKFPKPT